MPRNNRRFEIVYSVVNEAAKKARAEEIAGHRAVAQAADRSAKAAAKAQADATKQAADLQARATRQQVDLAARAARQQADIVARSARQNTEIQAREAARTANAQVREAERAARDMAKAAAAAARASRKAAEDQAKAWAKGGSNSAIDDAVGKLGELAAGYGALKVGTIVLDSLNDKWESTRKTINEAIASTRGYRDAVLELTAMKDRLGNSTAEVRSQLMFRAQTLQGKDQAIQYQEAALGSGQSAIMDKQGKGMISQEEFDKAMVLGGQFQATERGAAGTHGKLVGMLPMLMGKKGVTADQVFQKEQQLYATLQPGGATFTSGMDQLMKLSPLITTGQYRDVADAASLLSMFSLSNHEGAGDNVQQFTRATAGGLGKMKGVTIEGDSQKVGQYLKGLGATNQMDPIEIGKLITSDLAKQEAAAGAKGQTFAVSDYLMHQGYGAQEERLALMGFYGSMKSGQFTEKFEPLAKKLPDVGPIKDQIKGHLAVDPAAQAAKVDVSADLRDANNAMGANEYFQRIKELAFNRLQAEDPSKYHGTFESWDKTYYGSNFFKAQIINKADEMMRAEAKKVGVYIPQTGDQYTQNGVFESHAHNPLNYSIAEGDFMQSDADQAREYYQYGSAIAAKGGQPLPGLEKLVELFERVAKSTERTEALMRAGQKSGIPMVNPKPLPGRP